jgi:hypothetical protein
MIKNFDPNDPGCDAAAAATAVAAANALSGPCLGMPHPRQRRRHRVHRMTAPAGSSCGGPSQTWRNPPPAEIVLVGAHGGAGTSTLAALLRPAWDLGVIKRPGPIRLRPNRRPVVLVTRNTVAAAARAITATTAITGTGTRGAVLVVVGDGLPEPTEARYRFRVLEGRTGAVVRMPFIPAFRLAGSPLQVDLPRRARQVLAEIRALAQEQAPHPVPVTRP